MQAEEILKSAYFCDGHADTFRNLTLINKHFRDRVEGMHLSLPALLESHQNLQIMAIYTTYHEAGPASTVTALRILQNACEQIDSLAGQCSLVLDRASLEATRRSATPAVLMSLEGADPLVGSLELLDVFYRLGLRAIGFTHNHNSVAAGGCAPPAEQARCGLTPFGRQLVQAMNRKGMMIDTAHLGRQAFDDVMSIAVGPVVNSHSCCRRFVDLERNLDDVQLKALAQSGGLAAVTYVPKFLTQDDRVTTSLDVFRHLEYMVEVAGIDHVAIGSDFDGVEVLPEDLGGPQGTVHLVKHMLAAGWGQDDIEKVLGLNWYRVLGDVFR